MKRDWLITTLTSVTLAFAGWTLLGVSSLKERMAVVEYRLSTLTPPKYSLSPRPSPRLGDFAFVVPTLTKGPARAGQPPLAQ